MRFTQFTQQLPELVAEYHQPLPRRHLQHLTELAGTQVLGGDENGDGLALPVREGAQALLLHAARGRREGDRPPTRRGSWRGDLTGAITRAGYRVTDGGAGRREVFRHGMHVTVHEEFIISPWGRPHRWPGRSRRFRGRSARSCRGLSR